MEEATRYYKAFKLREKQRAEDEKKLFGASHDAIEGKHDGGHEKDNAIVEDGEAVIDDPVVVIDDSKENAMTNRIVTEMSVESEISVVDDNRWKWGDAEQVIFREVKRIDVNDLNAAKTVKDARINGTPVVLVGHVGWANFAKRWHDTCVLQERCQDRVFL